MTAEQEKGYRTFLHASIEALEFFLFTPQGVRCECSINEAASMLDDLAILREKLYVLNGGQPKQPTLF